MNPKLIITLSKMMKNCYEMKKALLIIDVQKSAVIKPEIAQKIEKLQYEYDVVFVSKFTNKNCHY